VHTVRGTHANCCHADHKLVSKNIQLGITFSPWILTVHLWNFSALLLLVVNVNNLTVFAVMHLWFICDMWRCQKCVWMYWLKNKTYFTCFAVQEQCSDDTFSRSAGNRWHYNVQCVLGSARSQLCFWRPATNERWICRMLCTNAEKWVWARAGTSEGMAGETGIVVVHILLMFG